MVSRSILVLTKLFETKNSLRFIEIILFRKRDLILILLNFLNLPLFSNFIMTLAFISILSRILLLMESFCPLPTK